MTVSVHNPSSITLELTPAAIAHCKAEILKENAKALRISVKESGCSGFMYVLDYIHQTPNADDIALDIDADLNLYVASDAVSIIKGTQMDYVKEGLNQQLKFNNPNAQGECGCGESFTV